MARLGQARENTSRAWLGLVTEISKKRGSKLGSVGSSARSTGSSSRNPKQLSRYPQSPRVPLPRCSLSRTPPYSRFPLSLPSRRNAAASPEPATSSGRHRQAPARSSPQVLLHGALAAIDLEASRTRGSEASHLGFRGGRPLAGPRPAGPLPSGPPVDLAFFSSPALRSSSPENHGR